MHSLVLVPATVSLPLIGMLTGLLPPSSGDATVFGHSITTEMNEIRKVMGVCPQHDILWKQLTGEEHLLLFANIRGVRIHAGNNRSCQHNIDFLRFRYQKIS